MGHFIRHIFLVAGAVSSLSLFSCRKDNAPADLRREAGRIYLDFETTDAARVKANGDIRSLPEEKELRTLDIFIYEEGPDGAVDDNAAPAYYEHAGVGPDTDEIALKTPTASFRPNANYCVHVIANCDGESHKATVAFSDKTTRKELLAAAVNTPAIFSGNRSGSRDGAPFVMEATVPGQRLNTADGQPVVVEAKLQRAAAKVVVRVKLDGKDDADGKRVDYYWAWQSGYQGSVYNAPTSVRIVAGNEFAKGSDQLDLETTGMIPSEEPEGWDSEKQYSASREPVEFVFYCYPNDWTQTYLPEEETFLNLRIPVVEATDGQVSVTDGLPEVKSDNYYKLQLNTESYKLERNHVYTIDATLRTLGAEAPEDSEPLEAEWRVAEWVAVDVSVEQDNIHFLELDHDQEEKIIVMANESDNQLVHYTSSHPIEEVTVSECYYTDGMGVDHPIEGGDDYPSVSYESGSLVNNLTVSSPIPTNNVPRYFTVTVRNSVDDERSFKVVQYPMEYITQTLSFWGAQQNRDVPGESYTYDKAPTRELKSGTGPGPSWSIDTWDWPDPDRIAYKRFMGNDAYIYYPIYRESSRPAANGDCTFKQYYWEGWVSGDGWSAQPWTRTVFGGNFLNGNIAEALNNAWSYHLHLTSTDIPEFTNDDQQVAEIVSGGTTTQLPVGEPYYVIGVPERDGEGYALTDPNTAKLASPSLMIASQVGSTETEKDFIKAQRFCSEYRQGFDTDGDRQTAYWYGDWRLPTEAELLTMIRLQYTQGGAVSLMLPASHYWTASGSVVHNKKAVKAGGGGGIYCDFLPSSLGALAPDWFLSLYSTTSATPAIRCVRDVDLYPAHSRDYPEN